MVEGWGSFQEQTAPLTGSEREDPYIEAFQGGL